MCEFKVWSIDIIPVQSKFESPYRYHTSFSLIWRIVRMFFWFLVCPFMALTDRNITQFAGTYSFLPFFANLLNLFFLINIFIHFQYIGVLLFHRTYLFHLFLAHILVDTQDIFFLQPFLPSSNSSKGCLLPHLSLSFLFDVSYQLHNHS